MKHIQCVKISCLSFGWNMHAALHSLWTQLESNNTNKIPQGSITEVWIFLSAVILWYCCSLRHVQSRLCKTLLATWPYSCFSVFCFFLLYSIFYWPTIILTSTNMDTHCDGTLFYIIMLIPEVVQTLIG